MTFHSSRVPSDTLQMKIKLQTVTRNIYSCVPSSITDFNKYEVKSNSKTVKQNLSCNVSARQIVFMTRILEMSSEGWYQGDDGMGQLLGMVSKNVPHKISVISNLLLSLFQTFRGHLSRDNMSCFCITLICRQQISRG